MMLKRLEDATASLGERSITGYAETACRRARMYAPLVAVWKTVPCPNPYDNKVASSRRFNIFHKLGRRMGKFLPLPMIFPKTAPKMAPT